MTLSIPSYFTTEFSRGIKELTEHSLFLGNDRSWIRRNFPGTLFGIKPNGEQTKFFKGELKEPAILPFKDLLIFHKLYQNFR